MTQTIAVCLYYPVCIWCLYNAVLLPLPDDDECTDGSNNCNKNAICDNTVGSFTCTCKEGYSGDGVDCDGVYNNVMQC